MTKCFPAESSHLYSSLGVMEDHPAHVLFEGAVKTSIVLYRFLATTSPYRRQVGTHFPTSRLRLRRARWDFTQTPHLLSKISLKMLLGL